MPFQVVTHLKDKYAVCKAAAAAAATVLRQLPAMFSVAHKDPAVNGVTVIGHMKKCINSWRDRHQKWQASTSLEDFPKYFFPFQVKKGTVISALSVAVRPEKQNE